jgi:hypothetical protein
MWCSTERHTTASTGSPLRAASPSASWTADTLGLLRNLWRSACALGALISVTSTSAPAARRWSVDVPCPAPTSTTRQRPRQSTTSPTRRS